MAPNIYHTEAFAVRNEGRHLGWFRSRLNAKQRCFIDPPDYTVAPCGRKTCTVCQPAALIESTERCERAVEADGIDMLERAATPDSNSDAERAVKREGADLVERAEDFESTA